MKIFLFWIFFHHFDPYGHVNSPSNAFCLVYLHVSLVKLVSTSVHFQRPPPAYLLSAHTVISFKFYFVLLNVLLNGLLFLSAYLNGASTHPGHPVLFVNMFACPYFGSHLFQTFTVHKYCPECIPAPPFILIIFWQICLRRDSCGLGTARHPTMHFNWASSSSINGSRCVLHSMDTQVIQKLPTHLWAYLAVHILRNSSYVSHFISFKHELSFSPTKHEHVAGTGVIFQGHKLLETQLFAPSVVAVRTVDTPRVVIATWAILHRPQPCRTLQEDEGGEREEG